jgi:hypothetical protein
MYHEYGTLAQYSNVIVNNQLVSEFMLTGNRQIIDHFPMCEQIFIDVTSMLPQIPSASSWLWSVLKIKAVIKTIRLLILCNVTDNKLYYNEQSNES